jgi:hypothetical protein
MGILIPEYKCDKCGIIIHLPIFFNTFQFCDDCADELESVILEWMKEASE